MIEADDVGMVELIEGAHLANEVGLVLRAGVSEALDSDLASGQFVIGKIYIAETAASKTPDDAIFLVQFFTDEIRVHGKPPLLLVIVRTEAIIFDVLNFRRILFRTQNSVVKTNIFSFVLVYANID